MMWALLGWNKNQLLGANESVKGVVNGLLNVYVELMETYCALLLVYQEREFKHVSDAQMYGMVRMYYEMLREYFQIMNIVFYGI